MVPVKTDEYDEPLPVTAANVPELDPPVTANARIPVLGIMLSEASRRVTVTVAVDPEVTLELSIVKDDRERLTTPLETVKVGAGVDTI